MRITGMRCRRFDMRLKRPIKVASGEISSGGTVLVRLDTDAGLYGLGEGSGVPFVTGEDCEDVLSGVERLAEAAMGRSPFEIQAVHAAMDAIYSGHTAAKAAIDTALFDLMAKAAGLPLYRFLGGTAARCLPVPMMNVLNGGAHAANTIDVQEFMILPLGAPNFQEAVRWCAEVYAALRTNLHRGGLSTAVGDEGGFAPDLPNSEAAIRCLLEAIESAGFRPGADFMLALDAAANEWTTGAAGEYTLPKAGLRLHTRDLIEHWKTLCAQYPIASLEDPLGEEDWEGWQVLTQELGGRVQLVGDDLFVTNAERLQRGLQQGCANSILIKPNQAGTLTEAMEAARLARRAGYTAIASHRSGETEDCVVADLAIALNAGLIKTGAPCRGERTAKYNRLLRAAGELGRGAVYPGYSALPFRRTVPSLH